MTTGGSSVDALFVSFQVAVAGRYSLARELGRGGMGIVYLAREVHLDRPVAIKLLPPELARDAVVRERFVREARLAAKLSHPNIIAIHAVDKTDGFVFYVMAYVDGETLAQRVRTRGPLPGSEAIRIFRDVAWALSYAHAHGLVHRDVKPDNILLENTTGRVYVSDFGIASVAQEDAHTRVSGTPEFMSPEQALGQEIDGRSDVYSLGVTAFYALTGRLPFEASSATAVLARQITEPAPPLASMGIPVARKLAVLVDRCLAKDPAQRPASADALAEQLGAAPAQRRELPVALRAFVKRTSRLNTSGAVLLTLGAAAAGIVMADGFGVLAGLGVFVGSWLAGGFTYCVNAARRLVGLGFARADVAPAFAAEIEQSREETALQQSQGRPLLETIMLGTSGCFAALFVCSFGTITLSGSFFFYQAAWLYEVAAVSGLIALPSALAYLTLLERRRDITTEFWAKVWSGRIGKAAFWLGRKLLGREPPPTAVTHRATELVLSMAAESLYDSLPLSVRRSLGDVPGLVRRLQDHAARLRELYDEVGYAIEESSGASSEAHGFLRTDAERIHAKLTDAVRALETIRLNLLRLHAGSATVATLTTEIDLAAAVSADAERLLAARQEVDRLLSYPRATAATPA